MAVCILAALVFTRRLSSDGIIQTDILVYGASLGGVSAAITAAEQGANVILATDSEVIGGQAVESGMSAFDDIGGGWGNWGLYKDLQKFLWTRSKNVDGYHAGLGLPQVGRVGSTPDDIEAFFLERIRANSRITLLTEQTISKLKKRGGKWHEATLTDTKTHEEIRVRFQYLIDGTETGRLFEQTATPFYIGFDTAEETGERFALPKVVRDALVEGTIVNNKKFGGLGNRVQAVTSPFVLLDRGYPGTFIPLSLADNACLSADDDTQSMIADAQVYRIRSANCQAHLVLAPEFDDTYDVYLVQHGSGSMRATIASPLWPDYSLVRLLRLQQSQELVFAGSFPLSHAFPVTLSLTSISGDPAVEGVLIVKRNFRAAPVVLHKPTAWDIPLAHYDTPSIYADIYLIGSDFPSDETPSIGGNAVTVLMKTPTTILIPHVSLRERPRLSLPGGIRQAISGIVMIPTALNLTPLQFSSDTPDKEIQPEEIPSSSTLKDTDVSAKEWRFMAQNDGVTIFSTETTDTQWRRVELWQDQPEQLLKTLAFVPQSVTRNPQPLFTAILRKGITYRLRVGLPKGATWNTFLWSANAVSNSSALFIDSSSPDVTMSNSSHEGVYDIWAKGTPSSSASYAVSRPGSPDVVNATIPLTRNQYQYLGKAALDGNTTLKLRGAASALLAIPNTHVDTYRWSGTVTAESPHLTLTTLPPGYYRMTVAGNPIEPAQIRASLESGSTLQVLSLPQATSVQDRRLVAETLVSNGKPLTFSFGPSFAQMPLDIHFYQEIPDLQDVQSFTMMHHPLIGKTGNAIPLFRFRNIISGASALAGKPEGLLPPHLGRNTLGMTLVVNPSNDFTGFLAESIDSPEVVTNSRALSAAYAYWMLYDSAHTKINLNCDPADALCTTKRVQPVIGLFADRLSMFPPKPYIREGRRMITKRIVTQNDIGIPIQDCTPAGCPEHCRPLTPQQQTCIFEQQNPVFFPDTLAAVGYGIDLHAFTSQAEYFGTVKPLATEMLAQVNKESLALIDGAWKFPYSRPTQVPLSALLSIENSHLFPASHNIGMSQIANGLYRLHVNELAIGQAVGHLLSYCLKHQLEPQALTGSLLRSFQHTLIDREVMLYPITDASTQAIRKPVQHLIVEGLLVPQTILADKLFSRFMNPINYMVFPQEPINEHDTKILSLFSQDDPQKITYRDLVFTLHPELKSSHDDNAIHAAAVQDAIVDEPHLTLAAKDLLASTPSKEDLYIAAYYLMKRQWIPENNSL
ncbi:MAG: FAD-dependent oxidoreductase [Candidatus Peregrinibacteria bacterium]